MINTIIWTVTVLAGLGLILALVLYLVAAKFKVEEDPRIDEVEKVMPGANCGGCGYAGCRAFADAAVKDTTLEGHYCPVGGDEVMDDTEEADEDEEHDETESLEDSGEAEENDELSEDEAEDEELSMAM